MTNERTPADIATAAAVARLADVAAGMGDAEALMGLQCVEVEAIAEVLRAAGHLEAAETIVEAHAHGDVDETDEHHARFLEIEAEHAAIDARISAERAAADDGMSRCRECRERFPRTQMGAGYGMCASCVHDATRSGWDPDEVDESSSASRQHYIDTGRYLTVGEVAEFAAINARD